jgi:hypothetical protein
VSRIKTLASACKLFVKSKSTKNKPTNSVGLAGMNLGFRKMLDGPRFFRQCCHLTILKSKRLAENKLDPQDVQKKLGQKKRLNEMINLIKP